MKKSAAGFLQELRPLLAGLIAVAVVLMASALYLFEGLELQVYNAWFSLRGSQVADPRIVVVGIDEASITQIGRWPWDRKVYADLLDKLGQAKAVAFDLVLSDASQKGGDDDALAAAIKRHGHVILGATIISEQVQGGQLNTRAKTPVKGLWDGARAGKSDLAGIGFVNMPKDQDAVTRAAIPVDVDNFKQPVPSLALAAVMEARGLKVDQIRAKATGPLQVGDLRIDRPTNTNQVQINFAGEPGIFKTVMAAPILQGKVDPATFKDKIVFVGAVTPTLNDNQATPFATSTDVKGLMPGVEIHANAASTYLNGTWYTRIAQWQMLLITLLMGLIVLMVAGRVKAVIISAPVVVGVLAAYVGLAFLLFVRQHLWLDVVTPGVAGFLVYTVTTVVNYLREQAERRRVRNLFGRYVSHNVVRELLENPEMLEMGGRRFQVTILFSDIRGFTSFSESRDPHEVVERINDYCKDMVEIIYRHGGTLDKYMGDGIMAYFGAPIPQPDHAERALRCAHEMREKMQELHERWIAAGLQPFKIGVGLNSGEVIAGNIGHPDRVEYSLIGSAVNLASRLESLTKEYATSEYGGIVFSAATYAAAPSAVAELQPADLGEVEVRGISVPVHIYTV